MSALYIVMLLFFTVSVTEENSLKTSIVNFKNKLADFFHVNQYFTDINNFRKKFEERRQKVKKAVKHFYAEAFGNENKTKSKMAYTRDGDLTEDEENMSSNQLITFHGYKAETHSVQTRDGYVLDIHRILCVSPKSSKGKEKLALLHHGLMGSSEDWLLLGPQKALPYLLSDAGYDVWLTNVRGNLYSRFDHGYVVLDRSAIWDFSFHEMGHFDLAAVIDYIQSRNKNELEINFIGHSMGGTDLLVLLSTLPQYNKVLYTATLLAPLAFMFQIKGPFKLLAEFYQANGLDSLNFLGENEFMLNLNFPDQFIEHFCISAKKLCINPLLFLTNGGKIDLDTDFLETLLGHIPAGTSTKTIIHYLQLINSGKFRDYDYGELDNLKRHGALIPPDYNLDKITLPIILFSSHEDWLCTMPSMQTLSKTLPNVVHQRIVKIPDFSHTDFVWGENAPSFVFYPILEILRNTDYSKTEDFNIPE